MTSNLGSSEIQSFGEEITYRKTGIKNRASKNLWPEFVNRIDEIIIFHGLSRDR